MKRTILKDGGTESSMPDGEQEFPWQDVESSRKNRRLQKKHEREKDGAMAGFGATACPTCGRSGADLACFYFESPGWTWQYLCGRAGWILVCDHCRRQVDFWTVVMS